MQNEKHLLSVGSAEMGIPLSAKQSQQLLDYVQLLAKWNKTYNLTAVRDPVAMVSRHILDSLSVLPHVTRHTQPGATLVDAGSGAGLPGIPLAIMQPDRQMITIDGVGKKSRFQEHVRQQLKIENLTVVHERLENWLPEHKCDAVLSRAFSSVASMVALTQHILKPDGLWLAMKGQHPGQELQSMEESGMKVTLQESCPLTVSGCEGERHLLVLKRRQ